MNEYFRVNKDYWSFAFSDMLPWLFSLSIFLLFVVKVEAQTLQNAWKNEVENMLGEYLSCKTLIDDRIPCNFFVGRALNKVYGISDFDLSTDAEERYFLANEIATILEFNSEDWTLLGKAEDRQVLNESVNYANLGKAIIAVQSKSPYGHVAVILPGEVEYSGNWKLKVPNSASFFLDRPSKSYVGRELSFVFSTPEEVKIYGRNY